MDEKLDPEDFLIFPQSATCMDQEWPWGKLKSFSLPGSNWLYTFWYPWISLTVFLMWIAGKYIPWSCRFSGTKYNHVPKMNASHQWKLILNKRRKWMYYWGYYPSLSKASLWLGSVRLCQVKGFSYSSRCNTYNGHMVNIIVVQYSGRAFLRPFQNYYVINDKN